MSLPTSSSLPVPNPPAAQAADTDKETGINTQTPPSVSLARPRATASPTSSPRPRIVQSPRDRVNSILEGARERKVTMDSVPASPRAALLHGGGENRRDSVDEETVIIPGGLRELDYQSTRVAGAGNGNGRQDGAGGGGGVAGARRRGTGNNNAGQNEEVEHEEIDHLQGWWARLVSEYGSIELENKGSVARDHLALERTFLAWVRTAMSFASIGIAITQLFRLNVTAASESSGNDPYKHLRQMGKPLGATFLSISIVMLGVGFHRYFEGQHWIIRGKFPASRGSIALVAAITLGLMVTSLVVVIVVEPGAFEK